MTFFDFFKKQAQPEADFVYDQAVIIDIDLGGVDDFGTKEQRQEIEQLQQAMARVLPSLSGIDGDEFGDGTCTIYVYGPSADEIFAHVESLLRSTSFTHIDITLQYGRPEDPSTRDKKFTL